jgi:uncharacterized protein (TIGR02001 family)
MEWDLYGGYKTEIAGVALDIGAIAYVYPGSGSYHSNTQEAYIGFGYGPATLKVSRVLGKGYFATTDETSGKSASGTMYYDLNLAQEIAPKLTASAHAGYTAASSGLDAFYSSTGKFSYADYNVGLAYDLNGFVFGVKYYFNSLKPGTKSYAADSGTGVSELGKSGVAVSLTRSF